MSGNQGKTSGAQPTSQASQGQPSGYEQSDGRALRAGWRERDGRARERETQKEEPDPGQQAHTPLLRTGHQQDPPQSQTGPPEREFVPAPAQ